jgi:hypothetical protein
MKIFSQNSNSLLSLGCMESEKSLDEDEGSKSEGDKPLVETTFFNLVEESLVTYI